MSWAAELARHHFWPETEWKKNTKHDMPQLHQMYVYCFMQGGVWVALFLWSRWHVHADSYYIRTQESLTSWVGLVPLGQSSLLSFMHSQHALPLPSQFSGAPAMTTLMLHNWCMATWFSTLTGFWWRAVQFYIRVHVCVRVRVHHNLVMVC